MSDNKPVADAFDLWLAEGLKKSRPVGPAFAENIVRAMEHLQAEKMLQKVTRQECIAKWATRLVIAAGVVALCCPPVLRAIYAGAAAVWTSLIHTIVEPARLNLTVAVLVVLCLGLLARALWEMVTAEF